MPALLLGSIGCLAETSDIQRQSFNAAFAEAGLPWSWSREVYAGMLKHAGGKARIAAQADAQGVDVDVETLHARKSALFQQALDSGVPPRPGVADTLRAARGRGWKTAFVTTTDPENVARILDATGLPEEAFDLVLDRTAVNAGKPDPECYTTALRLLDVAAADAVAVEDNPDGVRAAQAAGVRCAAFPGALHDPANFPETAVVVRDTLRLSDISPG